MTYEYLKYYLICIVLIINFMGAIINLILIISSVLSLYLWKLIYLTKVPANDGVIGYFWAIIYGFVIMMGLLTLSGTLLSFAGKLSWIHVGTGKRIIFLIFYLFVAIGGAAIGALFKEEPSIHKVFTFTGGLLSFIIILLVLFSFFVSNNEFEKAFNYYKVSELSLKSAVYLGGICWLILIVSSIISRVQNDMNVAAAATDADIKNNERMVAEIAQIDVTQDMLRLMVFADEYKTAAVKDSAVAKIKSHPDWQGELVQLLYSQSGFQVFDFLASNPVDSVKLFPHAVNSSLLSLASYIKDQINDAYQDHHLYAGQFCWEIERAVKTADRFKNMGTDFRFAMGKIKEALETKGQVNHAPFECKRHVEKWLQQQK